MTLDEAADILITDRDAHHSFTTDVIGQAEQLGAEALRELVEIRKQGGDITPALLPGETE